MLRRLTIFLRFTTNNQTVATKLQLCSLVVGEKRRFNHGLALIETAVDQGFVQIYHW